MISKADFTVEEWGELLAAPLMAAMAVTAADPSGLIGLIKENFASARSLIAAKQSSTNELIKALIADLETSEGRAAARSAVEARFGHGTSTDIKSRALEALRQAARITAQKAPAQSDGFVSWLRELAKTVSEASSEGGFMGFGGITVSEAEKATLAEIDRALAETT